ncbi:hypothetical protein [Paraburkholderia strydomiana]|uniref:hypothetical protein n=1 Tax=Paraburkholderia strydomiana TaxID=1245417 RepID=UPI0038BA71F7
MNSSYDEKKRKKSHRAMSRFFSTTRVGRLCSFHIKAAKVAANPMRGESLLPHADKRISDCQHGAPERQAACQHIQRDRTASARRRYLDALLDNFPART